MPQIQAKKKRSKSYINCTNVFMKLRENHISNTKKLKNYRHSFFCHSGKSRVALKQKSALFDN